MAKVDRAQKHFKGDSGVLTLLLDSIEQEDIGIWNRWRAQNLHTIPQLQGANLSRTNLEHALLNESILLEANFTGANLRNPNLYSSFCERANFTEGNLEVINLAAADLTHANLLKAYLGGADTKPLGLAARLLHTAR